MGVIGHYILSHQDLVLAFLPMPSPPSDPLWRRARRIGSKGERRSEARIRARAREAKRDQAQPIEIP
jgi:hypothetical protein